MRWRSRSFALYALTQTVGHFGEPHTRSRARVRGLLSNFAQWLISHNSCSRQTAPNGVSELVRLVRNALLRGKRFVCTHIKLLYRGTYVDPHSLMSCPWKSNETTVKLCDFVKYSFCSLGYRYEEVSLARSPRKPRYSKGAVRMFHQTRSHALTPNCERTCATRTAWCVDTEKQSKF